MFKDEPFSLGIQMIDLLKEQVFPGLGSGRTWERRAFKGAGVTLGCRTAEGWGDWALATLCSNFRLPGPLGESLGCE